MRNLWRDVFRIGNSFAVATGTWNNIDEGGIQQLQFMDLVFATSYTGPFFVKAGDTIVVCDMTNVIHVRARLWAPTPQASQ